jgi:hypothetical protein
MRLTSAAPSSLPRSIAIDRLLRFAAMKYALGPRLPSARVA